MELSKEVIENLIKQKELEWILCKRVGMERTQASGLSARLLLYKEDLLDILTAEYKVEVTRL